MMKDCIQSADAQPINWIYAEDEVFCLGQNIVFCLDTASDRSVGSPEEIAKIANFIFREE